MLKELSVKVFGNIIAPYLDTMEALEVKIRGAQMKYTIKEYISIALTLCLITFLSSVVIGSVIVTIFTERAAFAYTFSIIAAFLAAAGVFGFFYMYPSIRAKAIETKIERDLPFAVASMAAAASSGTHPVEIFKMLAMREGVLGEDSRRIYRDVKMFGTDISSALAKVANRTPSLAWSELLWGMVATMTTGGDVYKYLTEKTKDSMQQYRRMLESYSSKINFYTEIYITLIIVGTLFFIVLSSVMSPLVGGDVLLVQTFLVFFFVPATSAGFIVLLKGLSPL